MKSAKPWRDTMSYKIVMDSAGDLYAMDGVDFACAPLKITAGDREYVDTADADVAGMVNFLREYKGKASTACPSVGDYVEAFGDAEEVYCVTITSNLSGSYNAAAVAAETWKEQHPEGKIHVFDTLSAGPEMTLLTEKIHALAQENLAFEDVVEQACAYLSNTKLLFSLESLHNLANNGRVPAPVAKLAGMLGLRLIGKASDHGTLQPTGKARGEKKVVPELMKHLENMGYQGGKVRIHHCFNPAAAEELKQCIQQRFPQAVVLLGTCSALCSFYAEYGGMLIGFEA